MTTLSAQRERGTMARIFVGPTVGMTIRRSLFFFMVFLAVVAPWLDDFSHWLPFPIYDPLRPDPFNPVSPPTAEHWFGTDTLGLDVFTRVLMATRVDFTLALIGVALGGGLGCLAGAWAAYRRGWVDMVALRIVEVLQSFPVLLLGLAMFAAFGSLEIFGPVDHGMAVLVLSISMVNFPLYLRQVRSVLLPLTEAEFVQAAKCAGLGAWGIVWHHFIPNARGQILALFPLTCAYAIQIIAGLSFIGLGIEPPNPEWGSMIKAGATLIVQGHWWVSVFPGAAIVISVYSLTGFSARSETLVGPGGTSA